MDTLMFTNPHDRADTIAKKMRNDYPTTTMIGLYKKYKKNKSNFHERQNIVRLMLNEYIMITGKLEKTTKSKDTKSLEFKSATKLLKKYISTPKGTVTATTHWSRLEAVPNDKSPEKYLFDTVTYLHHECPDLWWIDLEWTDALLVGYIQSGKTQAILTIALIKILRHEPCIMVLRNSCKDAVQIKAKAERFAQAHVKHMKKLGYKETPTLEVVLAGDITCSRTSDDTIGELHKYENVLDAINCKAKLIIAMANGHQLKYLNRLMDEYISPDFGDFLLFTDEADALGYSEIKEPDTPEYHTSLEYKRLSNRANQRFEVSATVFDILVGNQQLLCKNIGLIRPNGNYKGIRNAIKFHTIKTPTKHDDTEDEDGVDPEIERVYTKLGKKVPFNKDKYNLDDDHPIICLHKTSRFRKDHDLFLEEFRTNNELNSIWTTVVEDGRGIQIYGPQLTYETITLSGETVIDTDGYGLFNFTKENIDIQEILQWFFDNGGAKRFSHIVIKSGDLAGRSRSYVSTNGKWHLTHEFYRPAKTDTIPTMIQACRVCHNRPDSIPLNMYTTKQAASDICKGAVMQDEQVYRLRQVVSDQRSFEEVKKSIWTKSKVPKAKMCHSKLNKDYKPIKVDGDDGGWTLKRYNTLVDKIHDVFTVPSTVKSDKLGQKMVFGKIYNLQPDQLTGTSYTTVMNVIDIIHPNIWMKRPEIMQELIHIYKRNTLAAYLTLAQQTYSIPVPKCVSGLNFRLDINDVVEIMYIK